ncbi:glutaminyl-peptide cyclotransferase [Prauserella muralis]|uniref:Glutaminyl-peptide cyclotransferase n=1 Tax=Prauserella muralis TaxID=588067 RepID=A0A2V4B6U9_9PSEU|nr:glutaminyl-peptide cyclotransferase [Prauserella muralis]PXY30970.1 glutaminyl-peptide cyclotransferase [Prauserella muralis]TWE14769.1 glutamine cyclotransferase [Prauserella muralis]
MRRVLSILAVVATLAACGAAPSPEQGQGEPVRMRAEVLEALPHDPEAFTQGLELSGGTLYEGTGLVGRSTVRAGPVGEEPDVVVSLPEPLFGEGITVVGDRVWQLTWRSGIAVERDATTLRERRRVGYTGEGWGLCHQRGRDRLVMSDGSSVLTFRDPATFAETGTVRVTDGAEPVDQLNELECVGDAVYANVWQTDEIVRIDPSSGAVTARIDASGLLDPAERQNADVLNGIAATGRDGQFLVTGKLWPKMFRVRFVRMA